LAFLVVIRQPDSTLSGSDTAGAAFSGGVAPGYFMDPLQGSGMDILDELFRSLESPALPDPW
jgi:hypothetical protein